METDDRLATQLARDLDGAFPAFVRAHQDRLYTIALRLLGDTRDAEEVAQDGLVRAYRAMASYPPGRVATLQLRGWTAAIVVNLARNRRRRLMDRRPPRSLEPLLAVGFEPADERTTSGASTSIGREDGAALAQALLRLPNPMRAAVVLRHVDGLSVAEVAAALSRPENTIKSDVHRGLQRLRADLERSGTIDAAPRGVQPPRPRTERLNGQTLESLP